MHPSIIRFVNIQNKQPDLEIVRSDIDATLPEVNLASADCPTLPDLKLFSTGHLPGIDFEKIASHVESCNACLDKMDSSLFNVESDEFLRHIKPIDESFINELQTPSELLQKALALSGRGDPAHHIEKYRPLFAKPSHEGDLGTFGKFRIIKEIGYGGMGVVFDAYDTLANRRIALKTLRPDLLGNQILRDLFLDEARNAAKLVHPHIILLLDVDTIEGVPYITMPLLKGESLQEFLTTRPNGIGLPVFMHIARQLLSGLGHLHSKGLVHRDIKPSNIFLETGLDGKLQVILLDLGLARLVENAGQSKLGLGTPEYAAPEQIRGGKIDTRADIFSLGKVFEKMLHGLDPQSSAKPLKKFRWNLYSDPIADLILKMTDQLPGNRPPALADVLKSLESKPTLKPSKVAVLMMPFALVATALVYFSLNHRGQSADNASNKTLVANDSQKPVAIPLDLTPTHVFLGDNYNLNAISGDGKIFGMVTPTNNLSLNYFGDPTKKTDVKIPLNPTSFAFNQSGNLLAVSNYLGDIAIVKIPTGKILFSMQNKESLQIENIQWGGRNSDVLLFSKNNKIFQLKPESQDKYPDAVFEIQDPKILRNIIKWDNIKSFPGTDFFLANASVSNNFKRILIVYSISENTTVKLTSPTPFLERNNGVIRSLGWVNNELVFATQNRNIFEFGLAPVGNPQNLIMPLVNSSELPHVPDDLIWIDTDHFVTLTDIGETIPLLHLYNRANFSSPKKFETNGEWVKLLKKLDGNSFAAFCKSGKILTYTLSKSLTD